MYRCGTVLYFLMLTTPVAELSDEAGLDYLYESLNTEFVEYSSSVIGLSVSSPCWIVSTRNLAK